MFNFFPTVKSGSGGESRHFYFVAEGLSARRSSPIATRRSSELTARSIGHGRSSFSAPASRPCCRRQSIPSPARRYEFLFEPDWLIGFPTIETEILFVLRGAGRRRRRRDRAARPHPEQVRDFVLDLPHDKYCEDRDGWRDTGMGTKHELGETGRPLWDEHSKQSEKYDPKVQEATWKSFKGKTARPITMRTIIQAAKVAPHPSSSEDDEEPVAKDGEIPISHFSDRRSRQPLLSRPKFSARHGRRRSRQ